MQEMISQKGINWNDLDAKLKRGRFIVKDKNTLEWKSIASPIFSQEKIF